MNGLYVESYGQGETIVMLHGWAMHSGVWRKFCQKLAKSYRLVCIDLPGHGRSVSKGSFSLNGLVEQILAVSPKPPCHFLGWSLGAKIAIQLARLYPDRVQSIVLMTGNPSFVQRDNWPGMPVQVLDDFANNLELFYHRTLRRFISLQVGMEKTSQGKFLQKSVNKVLEESAKPDLQALVAGLDILKQTDLRVDLAHLDCPVLCILGKQDQLVPYAVGEHIVAINPDTKIKCLSAAGHLPFITHEQEVCSLITDFIS